MIKKFAAFALSVMMVFTMTPMFAFAENAETTTENDAVTEVTEPETPVETVEPEETVDVEQMQQEIETLQAESESLKAQLVDGKFQDDGSVYQMEDISQYSKSMRIYAFYLGEGENGDAILIESNGKYLLMDTGMENAAPKLISCLKAVMGSETKLDVYFSHMHGDHTGGLESVLTNFDVGTVFFPDIELCENYYTPNTNKSIDKMYSEHVALAKSEANVVYLRPNSSVRSSKARATNTTSRFNVGGVVFDVIGPLGTYHPDDFIGYVKELNGHCGTKEGHCLNNSSLCTVITCGSVRYLSTGDIERQEEAELVNKYGYGLNCDILKVPHHGLRTSCSDVFASRVTPMWSFEQNHGYTGALKNAINTASNYGYNYAVASNKHSVIYDISGNRVRTFRDYNNNCKPDDGLLAGWVSCRGGTQYYDGAGYIHTGWNWISGYAYFMSGSSGFRYTGSHKINGVKVKFSSTGKLTSHKKPAKVGSKSAKASKKAHKITFKWRKASRASAYEVYRSTTKNGNYVYLGQFGKKKRTYKDYNVVPGQTYYYKVRALRFVAGGVMYGSFSKVRKAKAK